MRAQPKLRSAFTLVELLVAAGIIAMLLALVAISYPSINEREQLTRAVDKLRTGFLTARLWARRDNVVTGVRFNSSRESFIYVQQPLENWSGVVTGFVGGSGSNPSVNITQVGNLPAPSSSVNYIQKIKPNEDYIVLDSDVPHRISSASGSSLTSGSLTLYSSITINPLANHPFKIIRGVEPIPLQEDTILGERISVGWSGTLSNDQVLFLPSGQVANPSSSQITFTIFQKPLIPNPLDTPETAEVFLDCLSGTTRYTNP